MNRFLKDVSFAVRTLNARRGATLVAVITLALGLGANGAIFSIVDRVLLHPVPYPEADRLVRVWESKPSAGFDRFEVSTPNFLDWRREVDAFESLGALQTTNATLTGVEDPEVLTVAFVSANLPSILGLSPLRGSGFSEQDERPNVPKVMLSEGFWQRRFGGAPDVVGRSVSLEGEEHEVVGVLPSSMRYLAEEPELWLPLALHFEEERPRGARFLTVVGRLRDGVEPIQAEQQLDALARRLGERYPQSNEGWDVAVAGLADVAVESVRPGLVVLFAAVGLILLIVCGNVANLELVRTASRHREIALRQALGAQRRHLVRQLLVEDLLLGLAGGTLGLLVALVGMRLLVAVSPQELPQLEDVGFSPILVLFVLALSIVTSLLFGFVPALQVARPVDPADLKEGGRGTGTSRGARRVRKALVVAQLALAVVLLFGAALTLRSFWNLQSVDPGYATENVLIARIALPGARYGETSQRIVLHEQLLERAAALPGVRAATLSNGLPLHDWFWGFRVEGRSHGGEADTPTVLHRVVDDSYFSAMGIPLLRGRSFAQRDNLDAPAVVILDESAARSFFPGEEAVGKRISFAMDPPEWIEVIGVVGETRQLGQDQEAFPGAYVPASQVVGSRSFLLLRTTGDPEEVVPALRGLVRSLDPEIPLYSIETMEARLATSLARPRFLALLLVVFAGLALLLAVIGIYAVTAYSVNQRRFEIGTRMALGADHRDILGMVLREGARLTAVGVACGLLLALLLSRTLSSLLFGVTASDPLTLLAVCLLLGAVTLLACFFPARRAARIEPLLALRAE